MNYINDFSSKDQSSALSSSQWIVGFRNRFLLTRPGHSDLGLISAEWSNFTKRTGKGTHSSCVLRGLSQKVGIGRLNLSRLKGLPLSGPIFCITAPRVARTSSPSTAHSHPAVCREHCWARSGSWTGFRFLRAGRHHHRVLPPSPRRQQI